MFIVIFALCACAKSPAGPELESPVPEIQSRPPQMGEVGNGGHGVVVGDEVFLYDLVEAGIERQISSHSLVRKVEVGFAKRLEWALRVDARRPNVYTSGKIDPVNKLFPVVSVGEKLDEIHENDPLLAYSLFTTIVMYQWRFIAQDLLVLPVNGTILELKNNTVILIANRRGRSIYLSQPAFEKMNERNRAATVLHEAVYALIRPTKLFANSSGQLAQDGARVREIVGLFYDSNLFGVDLIDHISPEELPMLHVKNRGVPVVVVPDTVFGPQTVVPKALLIEPDTYFEETSQREPLRLGLDFAIDQEKPFTEELRKRLRAGGSLKFKLVAKSRVGNTGNPQAMGFQFGLYYDGSGAKTFVEFSPIEGIEKEGFILPVSISDDLSKYLRAVAMDYQIRCEGFASHREEEMGLYKAILGSQSPTRGIGPYEWPLF